MIVLKRKESEDSRGKPNSQSRRGVVASIVIATVVVHVVALAFFGLWVVARTFKEPEATFKVAKTVRIPIQTPEHKMNMAQHAAMTPKPTFSDRLVSTRPTKLALPDLPFIDMDQMIPLDPSELVSDQVSSMMGASGLGVGNAAGKLGAGGKGTGMSFFDVKDAAGSVVVMIDVSASMFGRTGDYDYSTRKKLRVGKDQSFQIIRDQAAALINGLGPDTKFGLIHWSGSARLWQEDLVPATKANKLAAKEHIEAKIDVGKAGPTGGRPGGTRHDYALEALFKLNPEVAFMLTDGNATRSLGGGKMEVIEGKELNRMLAEEKKANGRLPRIHTVYYMTGADKKEEARMLRGIASRTKGKFRRVKVVKRDERERRK